MSLVFMAPLAGLELFSIFPGATRIGACPGLFQIAPSGLRSESYWPDSDRLFEEAICNSGRNLLWFSIWPTMNVNEMAK
jgi:hypothetical protein